ncbi:MAG: hypothetical protein JWN86_2321 [Planctomycetota bacterium]|nr:hypothetical protein [Planctomycetota bacterium]
MSDEMMRQIRQRLESLRRAGIERIPSPPPQRVIERSVRTDLAEPPAIAGPPIPRPSPVAPTSPAPVMLSTPLFGEPDIGGTEVPAEHRPDLLAALASEVAECSRCPMLVASRSRTVFGEGSPTARLMFIGEAPGAEEDRTGRPFVGKAGILLTDMITKGMGLAREDVFIANVVKSRPPENRNPTPEEIANCLPYLERQIAIIRPQFLCVLGKIAASTLLQTALPMNRLRGKWHSYGGIPTIVTWHPAYVLRTPSAKKETWEDLQMLMKRMGLKVPEKRPG